MKPVPCPFCGDAMESFAGMTEGAFAKSSDGGFSVNCDCGVIGPTAPTLEEAVIAWNRRVGRENDLVSLIAEAMEYEMSFDWLKRARKAIGQVDD